MGASFNETLNELASAGNLAAMHDDAAAEIAGKPFGVTPRYIKEILHPVWSQNQVCATSCQPTVPNH
eukprot:COSAG01_NODE_780_length_13660_cov_171.194233_20_plen_67_part_00